MVYNNDTDLASISTRMDGRASIEHQIDIHVLDLIQIQSIPEFSLDDVLQGLKYVMDFRIKGLKMKNLDLPLMKRLLETLMFNMGAKHGTLLNQTPTPEADLSFYLFAEFLQEVEEFRIAVSEVTATDLGHALKIHRRFQSRCKEEDKLYAASVLKLITSFPQFSDWKDLVKEREWRNVEEILEKYAPKIDMSSKRPIPDKNLDPAFLFPPHNLYFDKNIEKLIPMYLTDFQKGLTTERYNILHAHYGNNIIPSPPKPSILKMLWNQITDFMLLVLIVVMIIQFATHENANGIVLLVVIVINILIGFTLEFKANKAINALMNLSVPKANVVRNGVQEPIDAAGLVPGDLVVLDEGDAVPADLRLVEVSGLEVIESILTGESVPTEKAPKHIRKRTRKIPLGDCKGNAFMSTVVAKGRAKGIVVRTGENTEIGRISKAITSQPVQMTPIQKKLAVLGKWLVFLASVLCTVVIIIGILWQNDAIEMIRIGISLAVSVIPEGLVAVVTVTMALGVKRMANLNAIVRQLPSVETLGSVQVICSDKTGTLTKGKMGTSEIWTADNAIYTFSESTSLDPSIGAANQMSTENLATALGNLTKSAANLQNSPEENKQRSLVELSKTDAPSGLMISAMVAGLCNNSSVLKDEETGGWKPVGDPTEVAMVVAAQKAGYPKSYFEETLGLSKVGEFPFDSERKLMSVIYTQSEKDGKGKQGASFPTGTSFVFAKGAPEGILSNSTHFLDKQNDNETFFDHCLKPALEITELFQELVSKSASKMAESGLRVLALAMKRVDPEEAKSIYASKVAANAESNLTFVGLIGLIDPAKQGVAQSIETCKTAGIRVIMITGDHVATATAIAKQLGIFDPNVPSLSRSMRGFEIDLLSEESLAALKPFPVVFARVSPDNKLKIVKALQSVDLSVAMTGDGVNDAPAIKKADVGIAMGINGTEITKQAADIVLADDNFTTIVLAVKEGRMVFDNIKKFIIYLLSCNSAEIFLFIFTAMLNLPLPFTVIQILWANIIADVPPAMSMGVDPFEVDIMDRPPRPSSEGPITLRSSLVILIQGLTQTLLTLAVFIFSGANATLRLDPFLEVISPENAFLQKYHLGLKLQRTFAFTALTMMQLNQAFLSRSTTNSILVTGYRENKWMVGAFFLSFGCLLLGVYLPEFNTFLTNVYLGWESWVVILVLLVIQTVVNEVMKSCFRLYDSKKTKVSHQISNA